MGVYACVSLCDFVIIVSLSYELYLTKSKCIELCGRPTAELILLLLLSFTLNLSTLNGTGNALGITCHREGPRICAPCGPPPYTR